MPTLLPTPRTEDFQELDHTVFILGAGASFAAGVPLIKDFLPVARDLFDNPDSDLGLGEARHFRDVFEFRSRIAQSREKIRIDLDDIEELFGLVEMSVRLGIENKEVRDSTVHLIAKTIERASEPRRQNRPRVRFQEARGFKSYLDTGKFGPKEAGMDGYCIDMYEFFAHLVAGNFDDPDKRENRATTVITFNYDLVIDDALRSIGISPQYHVQEENKIEDNTSGVSVLHLHGSTNWGICTKCKKVRVLDRKITSLPENIFEQECEKCRETALGFFLVPPSWDKTDFREAISPVWREALLRLSCARRVVIIGYSMPQTDVFFKYLITVALARNSRLFKLNVVDSRHQQTIRDIIDGLKQDWHPLEVRYRELLEPIFAQRRFRFYENGFEGYITSNTILQDSGRGDAIQINGGC